MSLRKILFLLVILVCSLQGVSLADPLTLKDCITLALERNPSLQAVKARVLAAQKYERAAYKNYFPNLELQYRYTRYRDRQKIVILGFDVPLSSYEGTEGRALINWPLFHGLALRVEHQLKKLDVSLAQVEKRRVRQELIFRVKEAFYELLKAKKRNKEAQKSVERLKAHLELARALYKEGLIARNDLLQSEVALAEGEHALVVAQNVVEISRARLNLLLERPVAHPTTIVEKLPPLPSLQSFESYLSFALSRRPEIQAALLALEQARGRVRLAQSTLYPWIDLVGAYEKRGTDLLLTQNPYWDRENVWVALNLQWRIFEWGKNLDQISAARAQVLAQEAKIREIRDQIAFEVRQAYLKFKEAQNRLKVTQKSLAQAEENFLLNEARYREQLASSTDVLDAEALLTSAKVNFVNALVDLHLANALLEYTIGSED